MIAVARQGRAVLVSRSWGLWRARFPPDPVGPADSLYEDRWIRCDDATLVIRGYYFPLGTSKVIAYHEVRGVTLVSLGPWTSRWRIWGTSNPRYWHLDWSRPHKDTALILDVGKPVRPVITPAEPGLVAAIIEERSLPRHEQEEHLPRG